MTTTESTPHRIVIVGGGIAGIEIAAALGRQPRRHRRRHRTFPSITLIDSDFAHVWKPMLHTIAAGTRDVSQQQTPYIAEARDAGFAFRPGKLAGLDRAAHEVHLAAITAPDGQPAAPEKPGGLKLSARGPRRRTG